MEMAPRNCRFLSLVVVEGALIMGKSLDSPEKQNHDKMSKNVRQMSKSNCERGTKNQPNAFLQSNFLIPGRRVGHTPSTAGTFRKKFQKNSGKTPETLSERFLEFPSRVRLGCPKPYNSRHLRLPAHFQNYLPRNTAGRNTAGGRFFFQKWFRRGPPRAGHGIPSSTGGISDRVQSQSRTRSRIMTYIAFMFRAKGTRALET